MPRPLCSWRAWPWLPLAARLGSKLTGETRRMPRRRVIAENEPTLFSGDPDRFATTLAYDHRNMSVELDFIALARKHMGPILRSLKPGDFQRRGIHSEAGPITLETLLTNITNHIPHHVKFIEEKRAALA